MIWWLLLWAAFFGIGVAKESWMMMAVSGSMALIAIADLWISARRKDHP